MTSLAGAVDALVRRKRKPEGDNQGASKDAGQGGEQEFEQLGETLFVRGPEELAALPKTSEVWMGGRVVGDLVAHAVCYDRNEIGRLLIGAMDGKRLLVTDSVPAGQLGTPTRVDFKPLDFVRAAERAGEKGMVVGWAHSHPTYGFFYSDTDRRFQHEGQALFREWTGIVIDPFRPNRTIMLRAFRVHDGRTYRVPLNYIRDYNGA